MDKNGQTAIDVKRKVVEALINLGCPNPLATVRVIDRDSEGELAAPYIEVLTYGRIVLSDVPTEG